MAALTLKNLPAELLEELRRRARSERRSLSQHGLEADIQLIRTDRKHKPTRHFEKAYDRPMTQALIDTIDN